jgi:hypothetical protein
MPSICVPSDWSVAFSFEPLGRASVGGRFDLRRLPASGFAIGTSISQIELLFQFVGDARYSRDAIGIGVSIRTQGQHRPRCAQPYDTDTHAIRALVPIDQLVHDYFFKFGRRFLRLAHAMLAVRNVVKSRMPPIVPRNHRHYRGKQCHFMKRDGTARRTTPSPKVPILGGADLGPVPPAAGLQRIGTRNIVRVPEPASGEDTHFGACLLLAFSQ